MNFCSTIDTNAVRTGPGMDVRMRRRGFFVILAALTGSGIAAAGAVSFREDVAPILVRSCLGCHDERKSAGRLSMSTFALLKAGGESAGSDILEPGDPDASGLIESVRAGASPRMPYKRPPLSEKDIRTLENWVAGGAKFDGASETETRLASLVDPLRGLPKIPLTAPASDPVTSLAFSPDGATLAAAVGSRVLLFDGMTGKPMSLAFTPDGATLAAAVGSRVLLFDAMTGKPRPGPAGARGPLNSVRFTPDGKTIVAAGGRAGMFGLVMTSHLAGLGGEARGHTDAILSAEVSPDGKTLATAGYDRQVILWDLARLKQVRTLKDHTDAVYALAFSPDGKTLASASADRTVKLWEVATGRRDRTLPDATAELYAVAFAADGSTVFAAGVDRSIRAWRVVEKDAPLVKSVFAHDAPVLRLVASGDGKTLVSSGEDRDVKIWDPGTLSPRFALPEQPDWPQAVALTRDGKRVAVGRHDGSIALYDAAGGAAAVLFSTASAPTPTAPAAKPELSRNATLNPPSPRGGSRGATLRVTLTGEGVGRATEVVFDEPGLAAKIVPAEKPAPNRLDVDLSVAPDARVGPHRVGVVTPQGVPALLPTFAVEAHPSANETESNDDPAAVKPVPLPATLVGAIDRPGDIDHFRFEAKAGAQIVFAMTAGALGSILRGELSLLNDKGVTIAESDDGRGDPLLTATVPVSGVYTLRVIDVDYGGSGNHFYRIAAGLTPIVSEVFPLGVAAGKSTGVRVFGRNLKGVNEVPVIVAAGAEPGSFVAVPVVLPDGSRPDAGRSVVVCEGPQTTEAEPNDAPGAAQTISAPEGVSGKVGREGDADHFRFAAKKGERWVVEVFGRRLGTPIDPAVEILDANGTTLPRAVLKPVAETEVAFRDHNSTVTGIRLTRWNNMAVNDTVLFGREVGKILALPRNPDDDCQLWAERGVRVGLLETTPEHHPVAQPFYKVEVHPPGTTFAPGGASPVTLGYRNDDGGPGFNKDARLTFDAPADGDYVVRVEDVRGQGGDAFAYHLSVRRPRPDFRLSVSPENPNVPRGGTALATVTVNRTDGHDAPVDVTAEGLPPGVSATPARVERGATTATLALSAEMTAPAFSPPTWRLIAKGDAVRHDLDPGGAAGGRVTVTPGTNLKVTAAPTRVVIRPGRQVTVNLKVERGPGFAGRVPIEVRNLPQGVRVLNIGLNGVLVTEKQTERAVTLYAEPWAEPGERPFYAVGRAESVGTEHSTPPIVLAVESAPAGPVTATSPGPPTQTPGP